MVLPGIALSRCIVPLLHVLTDLSALSILSSAASFSTFIVYVLTFFLNLFASRHGSKAASVFLSLLVIAVYLTRS